MSTKTGQSQARIYNFIGETPFAQNFDNVECDAQAFDLAICAPGLHTVACQAAYTTRRTILLSELFQRFEGDAFWSDLSVVPPLLVIRRPRNASQGMSANSDTQHALGWHFT